MVPGVIKARHKADLWLSLTSYVAFSTPKKGCWAVQSLKSKVRETSQSVAPIPRSLRVARLLMTACLSNSNPVLINEKWHINQKLQMRMKAREQLLVEGKEWAVRKKWTQMTFVMFEFLCWVLLTHSLISSWDNCCCRSHFTKKLRDLEKIRNLFKLTELARWGRKEK